jgi:hypothetical protein
MMEKMTAKRIFFYQDWEVLTVILNMETGGAFTRGRGRGNIMI